MGLFCKPVISSARLDGKTVIVTGSNTGIGKAAVLRFVKLGARVIMACRDIQKAEDAASEIRTAVSSIENAGEVVVQKLDLTSFASIRECAKKILETEPKIHILVNNAGVFMTPYKKTEDGFELQFAVNHLGHFLFTCLLLPRIIESAPARIINVSSSLHERGEINFDDINLEGSGNYSPLGAYNRSKLANVLFTKELAKKLEGSGVTTYALHPGIIRTEATRNMDDSYFWGSGALWRMFIYPFSKSADRGADTIIYCSTDERAGRENGLYYSDCRVKEPSSKAQDEETARKLWEESVRLVQLDFDPLEGLKTVKAT